MCLKFLLSFHRHRNFPAMFWKKTWAQAGREPSIFRSQTRYFSTAPLQPYLDVSVAAVMRLFHHFFSYWPQDFPAVSVFTSLGFSSRICSYWLGFSGHFCCYWQRDFSAVSVVACWDFHALTFWYGNVKSLPPVTRRLGFSGHIFSFWLGFSSRSFSSMGNLKKLYGRQTNCSGIDSGIFCWCQWHRWQFATDINDTVGKFATGVNDTSGK